jgi:hypothetical protein
VSNCLPIASKKKAPLNMPEVVAVQQDATQWGFSIKTAAGTARRSVPFDPFNNLDFDSVVKFQDVVDGAPQPFFSLRTRTQAVGSCRTIFVMDSQELPPFMFYNACKETTVTFDQAPPAGKDVFVVMPTMSNLVRKLGPLKQQGRWYIVSSHACAVHCVQLLLVAYQYALWGVPTRGVGVSRATVVHCMLPRGVGLCAAQLHMNVCLLTFKSQLALRSTLCP